MFDREQQGRANEEYRALLREAESFVDMIDGLQHSIERQPARPVGTTGPTPSDRSWLDACCGPDYAMADNALADLVLAARQLGRVYERTEYAAAKAVTDQVLADAAAAQQLLDNLGVAQTQDDGRAIMPGLRSAAETVLSTVQSIEACCIAAR
jgi:hypothetical protein